MLGCRSEPESADAGAKAETDEPARVAETAPVAIPDTPVSGSLFGKEFRPDKFELWNDQLTLQQGEGVFPEAKVKLFLFLDRGQSLTRKAWNVAASDSGFSSRPHVHVDVKKEGANFPTNEMYMDGYTLQLSFSDAEAGLLKGRIYLALPDDARSVVSGTFLVEPPEPPTAPSVPPSDKDKPYVIGKIDFHVPGDGMLGTGYCGVTSSGECQSNGAGVGIDPNMDSGNVESTTFKPRITRLDFVEKQVARHRHVRLEPGTYVFYAKWKETYLSWRWQTIEAGSATTLDLTLNPQQSGMLEVHVGSEAADQPIYLFPLDEQAALPSGIDDTHVRNLKYSLGLKTDVIAGKATFETLGPGAYRVFCGDQTENAIVKQGETATVKFP